MIDRYARTMETISVEDYLFRLELTGWFDEVPAENQKKIEANVREYFQNDRLFTFLGLSDFSFDAYECIYGDSSSPLSYTGVFRDFIAHSQDRFQPQDMFEKNVKFGDRYMTIVAFTHQGKRYQVQFPPNKSFDILVSRLITQALSESGCKQLFLDLPYIDQCAWVAFISPETYHKAEMLDLIPPKEYFTQSVDGFNEYVAEYYTERDQKNARSAEKSIDIP
jgi:hypothetical protein